jgi:propionyl-CoA carboxylase carboxyltransferase subunit
VARQHEKGKWTARERIAYLCDEDSFAEIDAHRTHRTTAFGMDETTIPGDGVVIGTARIDDRPVCVFAHDFTVFGGSLGEVVGEKITKLMEIARTSGHPLIGLNDSGGARIQEGVRALGGFGEIFNANTACSGVVPQLSAIMGPCAGGAVYSPAITDFTFMVDGSSHMFITGPQVIETVTGEEVSFEALGGASTHTEESGVAHRCFEDERQCLDALRVLLSYLPANNLDRPRGTRARHRRPPTPGQSCRMRRRSRTICMRSWRASSTRGHFLSCSPHTHGTSSSASPASMASRSASSRTSRKHRRGRSTSTPP